MAALGGIVRVTHYKSFAFPRAATTQLLASSAIFLQKCWPESTRIRRSLVILVAQRHTGQARRLPYASQPREGFHEPYPHSTQPSGRTSPPHEGAAGDEHRRDRPLGSHHKLP